MEACGPVQLKAKVKKARTKIRIRKLHFEKKKENLEEIRSEMKLEKDATMEEVRKSAAQCIKAVKAIENAQDRLMAMLEVCSGLLR